MRILYAIQGTGNGHLSRAMEIIPHFQRRAEVDVLLSGTQCELELPFPVRYRYHGLSFIFGKKGGIDLYATYASNRFRRFVREVNSLPVHDYDLIVSDFEPISSWACYIHGKPCIGLSNQAALFTDGVPLADVMDPIGRFILHNYAPVSRSYGFHFQRYNTSIETPLIRKDVRTMKVTDLGHCTVYLPAHRTDKVIKWLSMLPGQRWEVFSKRATASEDHGNITVRPISSTAFLHSMASSSGVLCAAGFGTTTEALFLRKKLCVIPMKGQFEQQCNAVALAEMGITVLPSIKRKHLTRLEGWLAEKSVIRVNYPDNADALVSRIISDTLLSGANLMERRLLVGLAE
ncbi:MAG: glycosyl transferase [Flavobacteriales bacterium]|nr:glycosyl transferase [Flavobacteriales bacterium]